MEIFEPQVVKKLTLPSLQSFGKYAGLSKAKTEGEGYDLYGIRPYRVGESVKKIDWNATAKTGELHIKTTHSEINIPVYVFLDKSPSMNYGFEFNKYNIACKCLSLIAQVALKDQNPVGIITNTSLTSITKLSGRKKTYQNSLTIFKKPNLGDDITGGFLLNKISRPSIPSGAVIIISDFLNTPHILNSIKQLSSRHKVTAIQIFDPTEYVLPASNGFLYLKDPENPDSRSYSKIKVTPKIKNQYDTIMQKNWEDLSSFMKKYNTYHVKVSTHDSVIKVLSSAFNESKISKINKGRRA
jgi:uncharacterized protein (DUF58 family)